MFFKVDSSGISSQKAILFLVSKTDIVPSVDIFTVKAMDKSK